VVLNLATWADGGGVGANRAFETLGASFPSVLFVSLAFTQVFATSKPVFVFYWEKKEVSRIAHVPCAPLVRVRPPKKSFFKNPLAKEVPHTPLFPHTHACTHTPMHTRTHAHTRT
jgi:hypothetical protein